MRPQNRKAQRILRSLHLWLGLLAGLFIVMMGLSGAIIVFRPLWESSAAPKVTSAGGPVSLALAAQSLAASYPGTRINRVSFPEAPSDPLMIQGETADKQRLQVFVDPASGAVLGLKRNLAWLDWIVDLHQNLLAGKTGRSLTGIIGTALLLLSLSGLFSWLAGQRDWKRALALPRRGPWRRINYQGHKWAGLWTNLFLLTVSSTGIVLAYPDAFQQAIHAVSGEVSPSTPASRMDPGANHGGHAEFLPLDQYFRVAAAAIPNGVIRELRLPSRGQSAVSVTIWTPGDIRPKGGNLVLLDPSYATILSIEPSSEWPPSKKLLEFANAIHKTEWGGLPLKLVWSLLGLAPVLLFLSGLLIWWNQRQTPLFSRVRAWAKEATASADVVVQK
jgi:uncharacterized iron-regulated membrane protein